MKSEDYPLLYRQSRLCASANQRAHFKLLAMKIILLLAIATFASFSWSRGLGFEFWTGLSIAIVLGVLIILTVIGDLRRYDRIWFAARAITESVKKESWLFMMKAAPYDNLGSDSEARKIFLDRLKRFLNSQRSLCSELIMDEGPLEGKQITESMEKTRSQTVPDRLEHYIKNRIHDEQHWYANKAASNRKQETTWFVLSWVLQGLAVILAFIVVVFGGLAMNPVGIVTTAGASVLSWVGARNYRELSQSYGFVAQRLSILEEEAKPVSTERELGKIVLHVEETISQEHTIWLARRLTTPNP